LTSRWHWKETNTARLHHPGKLTPRKWARGATTDSELWLENSSRNSNENSKMYLLKLKQF